MVNVLVVSDVRIYRDGLREVLVQSGKICVLAVAADATACLSSLAESPVDVVLIDCGVPEALTLAETIAGNLKRVKVVAFGLNECKDEIICYAEAGISGYVSKNGSSDDLVTAILKAYQGDLECPAKVAAALLERLSELAREKRARAGWDVLTPRELQVAQLIGEGLSNSEIAALLKMKVATTKTHVHHVLEKLGAQRRGQVVKHLRKGLSKGSSFP